MIYRTVLVMCIAQNALCERVAVSAQRVVIHHLKPEKTKILDSGTEKSEYHGEYANAYPSYEFSYKVNDPDTHDIKGQHEKREGDEVKGLYWLVDPNGYKRTVKYQADDYTGFYAQVDYEKDKMSDENFQVEQQKVEDNNEKNNSDDKNNDQNEDVTNDKENNKSNNVEESKEESLELETNGEDENESSIEKENDNSEITQNEDKNGENSEVITKTIETNINKFENLGHDVQQDKNPGDHKRRHQTFENEVNMLDGKKNNKHVNHESRRNKNEISLDRDNASTAHSGANLKSGRNKGIKNNQLNVLKKQNSVKHKHNNNGKNEKGSIASNYNISKSNLDVIESNNNINENKDVKYEYISYIVHPKFQTTASK